MTPKEFERLKDRIASLERESAKSQGALDQILETLKTDYGFSSVEDAEKGLKKMERELVKDETKLEKMLSDFETKWGDKL